MVFVMSIHFFLPRQNVLLVFLVLVQRDCCCCFYSSWSRRYRRLLLLLMLLMMMPSLHTHCFCASRVYNQEYSLLGERQKKRQKRLTFYVEIFSKKTKRTQTNKKSKKEFFNEKSSSSLFFCWTTKALPQKKDQTPLDQTTTDLWTTTTIRWRRSCKCPTGDWSVSTNSSKCLLCSLFFFISNFLCCLVNDDDRDRKAPMMMREIRRRRRRRLHSARPPKIPSYRPLLVVYSHLFSYIHLFSSFCVLYSS